MIRKTLSIALLAVFLVQSTGCFTWREAPVSNLSEGRTASGKTMIIILTDGNEYQLENVFIDEEQLVIRRPVSILGLTWAYDLNHVSRLYYSKQHKCPAFDYAYLHVYFGRSLNEEQAQFVIGELNDRYFPDELQAGLAE